MSTKVITAWVRKEVRSIEVPDVEYIPQEPSIEERVSVLEENKFAKNINTITLVSDHWVGDASPYSQVVTIAGVTDHSKVDLQPSVDQLTIFHEKDLAFVTENDNGIVTVFCVGQKPVHDYTMQVVITEVIVNE